MHKTIHLEYFLHPLQELQRVLALRQVTQHATAGLYHLLTPVNAYLHFSRQHQLYVHQSQMLCNAIVYSIFSIVKICMGRINANVVLNSQTDATLYLIGISYSLKATEEQWMM